MNSEEVLIPNLLPSPEEGEVVRTLPPRARRFLRMLAMGHSQNEARFEVGYSSSRASTLASSLLGIAYMEKLEKELESKTIEAQVEMDTGFSVQEIVRKRLEQEAEDNLDTMISLRDSEDPKVRFQATRDLLDRAGFKAKDKLEVEGKILATDGLLEALARARSIGANDHSERQPSGPEAAEGIEDESPSSG